MESNINLTEKDIRIMICIFDKETGVGLSKAKGITIDELKCKIDTISSSKDMTAVSISKIRSAIRKLRECEYVDFGVKKGLKKTYHVTTMGFNYMNEIKQNVITIKK